MEPSLAFQKPGARRNGINTAAVYAVVSCKPREGKAELCAGIDACIPTLFSFKID
jgi:hypothetical protein